MLPIKIEERDHNNVKFTFAKEEIRLKIGKHLDPQVYTKIAEDIYKCIKQYNYSFTLRGYLRPGNQNDDPTPIDQNNFSFSLFINTNQRLRPYVVRVIMENGILQTINLKDNK